MLNTSLVLDPRDFRVLEGLRLQPRKSFGGRVRGERLTHKKGISIDFADYREYTDGDDLRHLDWNVLARLGTPVTKTYRDEEDLAVHLLVDSSASMNFGEPSKFKGALRFACALGYIALAGGDAVFPRCLGSNRRRSPALRGRSAYYRLAAWVDQLGSEPRGEATLSAALRQFAGASVRAGVAIVVSDGLDPEISSAVRILAGRGHEVLFVQVLSREDLDPDLEGDLRLVDVEGGPPVEITANGSVLRDYLKRLQAHNDELRDTVLRVGGRLVLLQPTDALEDVVAKTWKPQGWVA